MLDFINKVLNFAVLVFNKITNNTICQAFFMLIIVLFVIEIFRRLAR